MFIYEECLDKKYENFSTFRSYGRCEECGKTGNCGDIKSTQLRPKGVAKEVDDWYYEDGELKVRRRKL